MTECSVSEAQYQAGGEEPEDLTVSSGCAVDPAAVRLSFSFAC